MHRIFLSAAHKSSGKTTVAIGIAAAFAARGLIVQTFKKGPDYIDPMWLSRASGRPCYNLDFNTQDEAEIGSLFADRAGAADLALIEGNKGLHDGVDKQGSDSSAALAKLLAAPVVLVIDANGITRGIAPLLLGYANFDPDVRIGGVIVNNVATPRHESKLREAVALYTDIPVLGAIGRDPRLLVRERHLGLTTPEETAGLGDIVARLQSAVEQGVDLDGVLEAAGSTGVPPRSASAPSQTSPGPGVRIAIARDAAFGFYYADDLGALQAAGAELVFFDTMRDPRLPAADGLFIGGGFPETQMAKLAANAALRDEIRRAAEAGLPIYAECGGLMYLSRSIAWGSERHDMVGFIPADVRMHDTPQGRGLAVLEETGASPWPLAGAGSSIPAHEFHYASLENLDPAARFAYRVRRGHGIDGRHDGIVRENTLAGFSHLRSTERSGAWAGRFVDFVRTRKALAA